MDFLLVKSSTKRRILLNWDLTCATSFRAALVSSLKTKTPDTEEIREARKLFTVSMRDMADEGRLDLKDVNSKFAQRNKSVEVAA